jgi:hypothetical protein
MTIYNTLRGLSLIAIVAGLLSSSCNMILGSGEGEDLPPDYNGDGRTEDCDYLADEEALVDWLEEHPTSDYVDVSCRETSNSQGMYYCCHRGLWDEDGIEDDDDTLEDILIYSEEDGVNLIVDVLYDIGYSVELQDGTWDLGLPGSPVLYPDMRFTGLHPGYAFFEFNSEEDPGHDYSSESPFYAEISPGYEDEIVEELYELLEQQ